MNWAFSTLRFLIILTETIALAAFLFRFSLDREIIDLADSIKQQQPLIEIFKTEEGKYRNVQERLAAAQVLAAQKDSETAVLKNLVALGKGKVTFQKLTINESSFVLEVATSSTGGLSSFLSNIKALPEVKSVSVDRVENRATSSVIIVSITAELRTPGKEVTDGTQP